MGTATTNLSISGSRAAGEKFTFLTDLMTELLTDKETSMDKSYPERFHFVKLSFLHTLSSSPCI